MGICQQWAWRAAFRLSYEEHVWYHNQGHSWVIAITIMCRGASQAAAEPHVGCNTGVSEDGHSQRS